MHQLDVSRERRDVGQERAALHRNAGHVLQLTGDHDQGDAGQVADVDRSGQHVGQEAESSQPAQQADGADQDGERRGDGA